MSAQRYLFLIALLVFFADASAMAASWQEAIERARSKAEEYHERATALGWDTHAGTLYNELDADDHTCTILGRLLGRTNLVMHLEKDYPTFSITGEEFRLAAISLDNWAYIAESLLNLDESRRIKAWNLDCVGQLGIPASAYIHDEGASTFYDFDRNDRHVHTDGAIIRILGAVEPGFSAKLLDAIKQNPGVKLIALGSGGGSVVEALEAGRIIREFNLETTLWNNCYSACSLVFLSGVERTIWSPYPGLGFHMASHNGIPEPANSIVYEKIAQYAREMGVDQRVVINAMMAASPDEMNYLDEDEMCKAAIATWIQRWCSYE